MEDGEGPSPESVPFVLKRGDKIMEIDGENYDNQEWRDVRMDLILWGEKDILVRRNNETVPLTISATDIQLIISQVVSIEPMVPVWVKDVFETTYIVKEGDNIDSVSIKNMISIDTILSRNSLQDGDDLIPGQALNTRTEEEVIAKRVGLPKNVQITGCAGESVQSMVDLKRLFYENRGREINLTYQDREEKIIPLTLPHDSFPQIGFSAKTYTEVLETESIEYSLFGGKNPSCITAGVFETTKSIRQYVGQLPLIFLPETGVYKEIGGFIKIGQIFPSEFNWKTFWILTALLSIMLAVINLLPIPALDGGHAAILLFEMITGRDLNPKILEKLQIVGMIILFGLFIYANGLDIWNLFT
jgi:membrane-associated protease RseP (regulator of RpoE activity)